MAKPKPPTNPKPFEIIVDPESGRQVHKYPSGVVRDPEQGRFLRGPDSTPITRDPHGMQKLGQRRRELARIRGIIRGVGLKMPPEDDLIAMADAEASAVEILTACFTNAFMNSDNLRGMSESWNKLTGNKDDEEAGEITISKDDILRVLSEFAGRIQLPEVIDV